MNQPGGMDLLDDMALGGPQRPGVSSTFVVSPYKPVIPKTQVGNQKQQSGIEV